MDKTIEQAVERAIATMHEKLGEPVTVDDMARAAMFSKFHFTRVFQRVTGLSPGRFLSAIRLQRAKHLLVSTELNVADISFLVGYNSVGTFSSRFSKSVGMSPTMYRRLGGYATHIPSQVDRDPGVPTATVRGVITSHAEERGGLIFAGLFPGRLPEGIPVCCTLLDRPGLYQLDDVPPGTWYLLAHRMSTGPHDIARHPAPRNEPVAVGSQGPIVIGSGTVVKTADVTLQPTRLLDPPVLLALLDARKLALSQMSESGAVDGAADGAAVRNGHALTSVT